MLDRFDRLRQYHFEWPAFDLLLLASAIRWLMLIVAIAGLLWLGRVLVAQLQPQQSEKEA